MLCQSLSLFYQERQRRKALERDAQQARLAVSERRAKEEDAALKVRRLAEEKNASIYISLNYDSNCIRNANFVRL